MSLKDKTAIVTGGARGIGRAIVQQLAEAGADVVIGDFRLDEAETTASEIQKATGRQVLAVRADVTDLKQVEALRNAALKAFG